MAINIEDYTNQIQDGPTRRGVYDLAYQMTEGNHTFKINGTAVTSTATELNLLDGVSVTATEIDQRCFTLVMPTCTSDPTSSYAVIPWTGNITEIFAVGSQNASGGPATVYSFATRSGDAAFVSMSGNIITVVTGTSLGVAYTAVTATASNKAVLAGETFRASSNGFCSGPASLETVFTVLMDIT